MHAALDAAYRAFHSLRSECGADRPDVVNVLLAVGRIYRDAEDYTSAEAAYRQASEIMQHWIGEPDETVQRLRIQACIAVGDIERVLGRLDASHATLTDVVADAEKRLGPWDLETGMALNALGIVCKYAGRFAEGETAYRGALAIIECTAGADSPMVASIWHNLGGLAFDAGDYAAAELPARRAVQIRQSALGTEHPDVAADLLALAPILDALGRTGEAAELYARASAILERTPANEYDRAVFENNLGVAAAERGDVRAAKGHYTTALTMKERLLGPEHADVALTLHNLGALAYQMEKRDEARGLLCRALTIFETTLPATHPKLVACREMLADVGRTTRAPDSGR